MKTKLTVVYSLLVVGILGFGVAAYAASSTTDVRKANTGAGFGSSSAVRTYVYERVLDFTATASTSTNGVGTLETTGNAGDTIALADLPAGFKCTNAYYTPGKAQGETCTAALKLGTTSLVASINLNGTAGTPLVLTVVDLAPTTAETTLNLGPASSNACETATGTLTLVGIVIP